MSKNKNQTIALSGASGFIGKHLSRHLTRAGHTVLPIPRQFLFDRPSLQHFFKANKPDVIYHLSSYGNMFYQDDIDLIIQTNIIGTYNMLRASLSIDYQAFINVTSSSLLLLHQTFYSASKASSEWIGKAFFDEYHKPVLSIRPYSVYGTGEASFRFIPSVFASCLSGKPLTLSEEPVHDWIYVDDVVSYLTYAADAIAELAGRHLGIGTGIGTTNKEVVSLIEEITGNKAHITQRRILRPFDSGNWVAPGGVTGQITLEGGLRKIYDSLRGN